MDFNKLFTLGGKNVLEDTEKISLEGKEDKEIRKNYPRQLSKAFSLFGVV